jgi:hypothetical protein
MGLLAQTRPSLSAVAVAEAAAATTATVFPASCLTRDSSRAEAVALAGAQRSPAIPAVEAVEVPVVTALS